MMSCLHFTCAGSSTSPPVLFLHGFMGSGADWDVVVDRLSDQYFCVCVDLPGHGGSTKFAEPSAYSLAGAAAGVLTVLRKLHVRKPMLVGYSMGARVALAVALHTPNVFTRLVLESGSPGLLSEEERAARATADDQLAAELESGSLESFLERWYANPLFASLDARPDVRADLMKSRAGQDQAELANALRGMTVGRQKSYWDRLPQLVTPTLIVTGESDEKYVDLGGEMAGLCYHGVTAIVPNAGHNVHREQPEAFAEIVGEFLTS